MIFIKSLWHIHKLALHPLKVYTIVLGIFLSFGAVSLSYMTLDSPPIQTNFLPQFSQIHFLWQARRFDLILFIFTWMTLVWATLGGGVTRIMALDVLQKPKESLWQAILFCSRPALLVPSSLASLCFFIILFSPQAPYLLILILPIWLYAGFLYGALTTQKCSLKQALSQTRQKLKHRKRFLLLQLKFLGSFFISTGMVYLFTFGYIFFTLKILGIPTSIHMFQHLKEPLAAILILPVLLYSLGYTTSNLKSLQIYLYTELPSV